MKGSLLLTWRYNYCPYCAHILPAKEPPPAHRQCVVCDRCLTCEELASRGWKKNHPA